MSKNVKGGRNINKELEKIIKEWIELRGESLEKLSIKSEIETLNFENRIKEILYNVQENKQEEISRIIEEMIYNFMDYCHDKNEIYYKAGFGDCLRIVIKTLGKD